MSRLRRWQLNSSQAFSLILAADARLSATDYTDDQVWRLTLGAGDAPALTLQTRYGGRAGLVSLAPMWVIDRRVIYQTQAHAVPPVLTFFAPNYLRVEAEIVPKLTLLADYWAMESHVVGARYTLENGDKQPLEVRLDLFGHVGLGGKEQPPSYLTLSAQEKALYLGRIGNLHPVVVLEKGQIAPDAVTSQKLSSLLVVPARGQTVVRWVHAGLTTASDSLALARRWLNQNWTTALRQIVASAAALPMLETGDSELDVAIVLAYQRAVQAFLKPTGSLPHASFVAVRHPETGFSLRGDGSDHVRAWSGQNPTIAYPLALALASVSPALAQGVVRNYIAAQGADGGIDWKPGLASQRSGQLCLPVLARLAWGIFQYTEDSKFLADVFPALYRFFQRWLKPDLDVDQDGVPEWQSETQTGYPFMPTFGVGLPYGQGADIRLVEAPDLTAYLLSEAISLREIAYYLHDSASEQQLDRQIEALKQALEGFWHDGRYGYRDRDSHTALGSMSILEDGHGDEEHLLALKLTPPNRLVIQVQGGVDHVPRATLFLHGFDHEGKPVQETAEMSVFAWQHGRGVYTSRQRYSQVDRVWFEGLTRPYHVRVRTLDLTRLDISALLPLWSVGISPERAVQVMRLMTQPEFLRPNGVTMCSAHDAEFDPANVKGGGGIWVFWQTLIGEGLIECGQSVMAAELLKRLLKTQAAVLRTSKDFAEYYHSDEPIGLGEAGHVGGIVPLHLLLRVIGVRVVSSRKVWTGGAFVWGDPVTMTQHSVRVSRASTGTQIRFPSGHTVDLPADAPWQEVIDPTEPKPRPSRTTKSSGVKSTK